MYRVFLVAIYGDFDFSFLKQLKILPKVKNNILKK
jgi:hypothetical protein